MPRYRTKVERPTVDYELGHLEPGSTVRCSEDVARRKQDRVEKVVKPGRHADELEAAGFEVRDATDEEKKEAGLPARMHAVVGERELSGVLGEEVPEGVEILEGKVPEVAGRIASVGSTDELDTLLALENATAQPRKGVRDAIEARRKQREESQ